MSDNNYDIKILLQAYVDISACDNCLSSPLPIFCYATLHSFRQSSLCLAGSDKMAAATMATNDVNKRTAENLGWWNYRLTCALHV